MNIDGLDARVAQTGTTVEVKLLVGQKCRKVLKFNARQAMIFLSTFAQALSLALLRKRADVKQPQRTGLDPKEGRELVTTALVTLRHCCDQYGVSYGELDRRAHNVYLADCANASQKTTGNATSD